MRLAQGDIVRVKLPSQARDISGRSYAASWNHSASASDRMDLNLHLRSKCLWWLKWLCTDEWTETNFCKVSKLLNFCIARSRLRNGWCEFSLRLLYHCLVSWMSEFPAVFTTAPYDVSLSVTTGFGFPYRFSNLRKNFHDVLRSWRFVTNASSTSPSWSTARHR